MTQVSDHESIQEMFIFTVKGMLAQLEQAVLVIRQTGLEPIIIGDILKNIHTIERSSGMTIYKNINLLAHSAEDLFFYAQEQQAASDVDKLLDIATKVIDFIKTEINKLENKREADGKEQALVSEIEEFLVEHKVISAEVAQYVPGKLVSYQVDIYFEEGCEMENVRAFSVLHNITQCAQDITHIPEGIDSSDSAAAIQQDGFHLYFQSAQPMEALNELLDKTPFLKSFKLQRANGKPQAVRQIVLDTLGAEEEERPLTKRQSQKIQSAENQDKGAEHMAAAEEQGHEDTQKGKFLTFSVGNEYYGIEIKYVKEIIGGIQAITEVPELPEYVKGIINLRGTIIPVMDIRLRFKKEPKDYNDRTCIVVVNMKDILIGLIVDAVSEVLTILEQDIVAPPSGHKSFQNRYIKGIGKVGNEVKLLLDCNKLISDEEFASLTNI
jgi:purine-binding chemotaxis protein CheW